MIIVESTKTDLSHSEKIVLEALEDSIKKDLANMKCARCKSRSRVYIVLDKKKLSALSTRIRACCVEFEREISDALFSDTETLR